MLSRKYYEMFADVLAFYGNMLACHANGDWRSDKNKTDAFKMFDKLLVDELSSLFKQDNRHFDRQKFHDRVYKQIGYPSTR
tara:strand:+ start:455 stop:697 length:243 start_codon:yes stop_codon:yes gene_type:complete